MNQFPLPGDLVQHVPSGKIGTWLHWKGAKQTRTNKNDPIKGECYIWCSKVAELEPDIKGFAKAIFPNVRRVMPSLVVNSAVQVEPMPAPDLDAIFKMHYTFGTEPTQEEIERKQEEWRLYELKQNPNVIWYATANLFDDVVVISRAADCEVDDEGSLQD